MIRIFTSKTQSLGERGENEAVAFLMKQGFSILDRNVPNKFGEIDIVAQKDKITYFFEVKAGNQGSINPAENLHPAKLRKFLISAEYYALSHNLKEYRAQGIIVLFHDDASASIEILDVS